MASANEATGIVQVPVEQVRADERQVRKSFDEGEIEALAVSFRQVGVLEPIELRTDDTGAARYVIVYGERRWRAAQRAGLETVPAFVDRDVSHVRRRQLHENVMRVDLNPVELAANVVAVMVEEELDTKALGEQLRWSVRKVQRLVEIHEAPDALKRAIVAGVEVGGVRRTLSVSHALDVLRAYRHYARDDEAGGEARAAGRLDRLVRTVLEEGWSGHELQEYVGRLSRVGSGDPLDSRDAPVSRPAAVRRAGGPGPAVLDGNGGTASRPRKRSGRDRPLFEAHGDRLTIFLDRVRATTDGMARKSLRDALLALVADLGADDAPGAQRTNGPEGLHDAARRQH